MAKTGENIQKTTVRKTAGAPQLYKSPKKLREAIDDYFKNGVAKKTVIVGQGASRKAVEIEVPTITGLCIHLGFESRQSFYDYEKREGFSYTIKRARLFIEKEYEEALQWGNVTGAIFALKNLGWEDKTMNEVSGDGLKINFVNYARDRHKDGDDI